MPTDAPSPLLPFQVSICGIAEIPDFAARGVSHVLSILDPDHPDIEAFGRFAPHARTLCRFHDVVVTVEGHRIPNREDVELLLELGEKLRGDTVSHLLVHCHMGVSRSTAAAAILMAQHAPGREDEAFAEIARIRPRSWPNSLMIAHADEALGRHGALVRALKAHHERTARADPELAAMIRAIGRAHEVPDLG